MLAFMRTAILVVLVLMTFATAPASAAPLSRKRVEEALSKAATFYRNEAAVSGGYVWQMSADLTKREGEGTVTSKQVWVQPPGTPTVGEAYLHAYRMTGDSGYLTAAVATARALVFGQLRSGGWGYVIEFNRQKRSMIPYRLKGAPLGLGVTTLDDDTTQSALRFLMRVDRAMDFKDELINTSVLTGLKALVKAQYPNGAWPQTIEQPYEPSEYPVLKASVPESWPRKWNRPRHRTFYTLNDNVIPDMIETMLLAARIYGRGSYREAAKHAAEFLILAQLPAPQPAWAQQYDKAMHPAWARRFEPPAVTGSESRSVIRALMRMYRERGDKRWLAPIPSALAYFEKSLRSDGKLARFYELGTNRPLYFTKRYVLTYDDSDLPTHYAFVIRNWVPAVRKELERLQSTPFEDLPPIRIDAPPPKRTEKLDREVTAIVSTLDERGAWVEDGRLRYHGADDPTRRVIRSATFARNIRILAGWIKAAE